MITILWWFVKQPRELYQFINNITVEAEVFLNISHEIIISNGV